MYKLEKMYDKLIKEIYLKDNEKLRGNVFSYDYKYKNYLKDDVLDNWLKKTPKYIIDEFENSDTDIFKKRRGRPPEVLLVSSKWSNCFISLSTVFKNNKDNSHLKVFLEEEENISGNTKIYFKKKVKINGIKTSDVYIDAYFRTNKEEFFFETKCRDIFDKNVKLISSHFFEDRKNLLGGYLIKDKDYTINDKGKYYLNKTDVLNFDLNRFVKIIMGIISNKEKKVSNLVYYYFIPAKDYLTGDYSLLCDFINMTLKGCMEAFKLNYIREICKRYRINLKIFIGNAPIYHYASSLNTHLFFEIKYNE